MLFFLAMSRLRKKNCKKEGRKHETLFFCREFRHVSPAPCAQLAKIETSIKISGIFPPSSVSVREAPEAECRKKPFFQVANKCVGIYLAKNDILFLFLFLNFCLEFRP